MVATLPAADTPSRRGLLLTNLGTPAAPTKEALRPYLREFLGDRRVIDYPRWLWDPILHGIILNVRPRRSAALYAEIWQPDGSPLLVITERLAEKVRGALAEATSPAPLVALGMRYGQPSIGQALRQLRAGGVTDLAIVPLYPQFSHTTVTTTYDAVEAALERLAWQPPCQRVEGYHQHPRYLDAVAATIERHGQAHGPARRLLFSFHGIPKRYGRNGDPYEAECHATARLVAELLRLPDEGWGVAFQSRFGPEPWLLPYTDQLLTTWARAGVESVDVVCPGFAVDCLETLEEMAVQNRDLFLAAGGQRYRYIPALNDDPSQVSLVLDLAARAWAREPA